MQVLPCGQLNLNCWAQLPPRGAISAVALLRMCGADTRRAVGCACVLTHFFIAAHSVEEHREKNRCSSTIALCRVH